MNKKESALIEKHPSPMKIIERWMKKTQRWTNFYQRSMILYHLPTTQSLISSYLRRVLKSECRMRVPTRRARDVDSRTAQKLGIRVAATRRTRRKKGRIPMQRSRAYPLAERCQRTAREDTTPSNAGD